MSGRLAKGLSAADFKKKFADWQDAFKAASSALGSAGSDAAARAKANEEFNRVYQRREVELILLVKHLLYMEKYTIDGARRKVDEHRKSGELRGVARAALDRQTLASMEAELAEIVDILSGSRS